MNVRREGVHMLALAAKPAPAAAMPSATAGCIQGKGELSYRTWKDPRCSIIFMPCIKARPRRIGKSSYGLRLENYRWWMVSHQLLGRRFGFLRPLKWPGIAEISPLNHLPNKGPYGTKARSTSLTVCSFTSGPESQGGAMTTLQAICLGAMLAWTPSLVVMALLLREPALDELQRDPS